MLDLLNKVIPGVPAETFGTHSNSKRRSAMRFSAIALVFASKPASFSATQLQNLKLTSLEGIGSSVFL